MGDDELVVTIGGNADLVETRVWCPHCHRLSAVRVAVMMTLDDLPWAVESVTGCTDCERTWPNVGTQ